jgi:hypothetical protein
MRRVVGTTGKMGRCRVPLFWLEGLAHGMEFVPEREKTREMQRPFAWSNRSNRYGIAFSFHHLS